MPHTDPKSVALTYVAACGAREWHVVEPLLSAELTFSGPGGSVHGAQPYLAILRRLGGVWVRSDVKRVFVDGAEVCVIYDFVTDTDAGAVPIVEWLRVEAGKIVSVFLVFDRVSFKPASDELARRFAAR
ncbi:MAG: nuclear transport factor 2 family protein [Myxococcota bacterium]